MNSSSVPAIDFKNYFGPRAKRYADHRPRYPAALLEYLAREAGGSTLAWDCGTGNGQAAVGLAQHFTQVVATDPSADMIAHAIHHTRVMYRVARYESGLPAKSANLVTVAQALHWFEVEDFFREVRRVLVPDGLFAAWGYSLCRIEPALDDVIDRYYKKTLGTFWPPERRHTDDGYRSFVLPLNELAPPPFELSESWTMDEFLNYVRTWSGTNRCVDARGEEPVLEFEEAVRQRWSEPAAHRQVRWPIHLRVGRLR